jgi:hypothetical protein
MIKIIFILILFAIIPYLLLNLLKKGLPRKWFALVIAIMYGVLFFVLCIFYINKHAFEYGLFTFITTIFGGYPTAYLLFPILHRTVVSK